MGGRDGGGRRTPPPYPPDRLLHHLRSCTTTAALHRALAVFIAGGHLFHDSLTICKLVELLALSPRPGFLHHAQLLVDLHPPPSGGLSPSSSIFLHNILIRGHSLTPSPHRALLRFSRMLHLLLKPDRFTFPCLIKAASLCCSVACGTQVHNQVVKLGFHSDLYVLNNLLSFYSVVGEMESARRLYDDGVCVDIVSHNTLIDGYVKYGDLRTARKLFDEMPRRNEVSWCTMMSGYVRNGQLDAAQNLFDRMPVKKDVVTCNSMISGFTRNGMLPLARKLFDEMPQRNEVSWSTIILGYVRNGQLDAARYLFDRMPVEKNVVTSNSMISEFARNGLLPLARKLFDEMPERSIVSWNAIITGYAQCGVIDMARRLFDEMPEKNVSSWSCLISGYAQSNRCREALELFKEMLIDNRVKPNEVTFLSVLSACAQSAAIQQGKWVHAYIDRIRMKITENLAAALIDMYAKCGNVESSMELFSKLDSKDVSTWNALITGLAVNGCALKSLEVLNNMQGRGVTPNDITFLGVLTACCHGGLVEQGRQVFKTMCTVYGIKPEIKHYGCMVDLLARSGLLEEAEEVVRGMPVEPDAMVLGALLGACKIHKNFEVADRVSREFLKLNATEPGCHVLLSNIYSASGRWNDAVEMRDILKKKRIKKEPGSSLVELDGTVYEFIAGDKSQPETGKIYLWLDEMTRKFQTQGYVPFTADVLHDLDGEDKEISLINHSEKLAVAFAMIKYPVGSVSIRIVKNLRICSDCHLFMKYVSKSCQHRIFVRDRSRFHHFKDGICSCNDYW